MAITGENSKPLDLESAAAEQSAEQSQDEIRDAAQTDKVVRGVNGSLTPKARKLRPLAGIILIALVVLAAAYMRHGLASRNNKAKKQTETAQVGSGPATTVEKGMLSDQARNGLDIGQSHVPASAAQRSSIATGESPAGRSTLSAGTGAGSQTSSIPPLEYRQTPASTAVNGSLSFAEQRRLEEYNREREAMEAATSVKGNLPSEDKEKQNAETDPLQAIQAALINARSALGAKPRARRPSPIRQLAACRGGTSRSSARTMSARTISSKRPASASSTASRNPTTWTARGNPPWASMKSRLAGSFQPCWNSSSTPICRG